MQADSPLSAELEGYKMQPATPCLLPPSYFLLQPPAAFQTLRQPRSEQTERPSPSPAEQQQLAGLGGVRTRPAVAQPRLKVKVKTRDTPTAEAAIRRQEATSKRKHSSSQTGGGRKLGKAASRELGDKARCEEVRGSANNPPTPSAESAEQGGVRGRESEGWVQVPNSDHTGAERAREEGDGQEEEALNDLDFSPKSLNDLDSSPSVVRSKPANTMWNNHNGQSDSRDLEAELPDTSDDLTVAGVLQAEEYMRAGNMDMTSPGETVRSKGVITNNFQRATCKPAASATTRQGSSTENDLLIAKLMQEEMDAARSTSSEIWVVPSEGQTLASDSKSSASGGPSWGQTLTSGGRGLTSGGELASMGRKLASGGPSLGQTLTSGGRTLASGGHTLPSTGQTLLAAERRAVPKTEQRKGDTESSRDFELAKKLQEQTDAEMARRMQSESESGRSSNCHGHASFLTSGHGHPYCEMCCGRRGACGRSVVTVTAAAPNWAVAGGASATAGDQLDSYEALLDLEDVSRGVDEKTLSELTLTHTYSCRPDSSEDARMCAICQDEYSTDSLVRRLPCLHIFHVNCIDQWLASSTKCPTCMKDIKDLKLP